MSLVTPTTKEVGDNIIAQLESSLNQTIPLLPKSFMRVLAKALAGVFILLYKYAGFMFRQIFVVTASIDETEILGQDVSPLIEWGRLIGIGDPALATNAELFIDITVELQEGFLPTNTQLLNSSNGVTYITLGSVNLDSPTVQVIIKAVSDQSGGGGAGVIGNLDNGAVLTFANPLANVNRNTVVVSTVVTGADGESEAAYRQRITDRFQKQPQGGAYADYELWGEEPAGILNVYPYTSDCPGQVDLFVEATVESSGSPDGIPTASQLQEVLDSVETDPNGVPNRRPANALVNSFPITRVPFEIIVTGIVVDNLAQVQADITEAVTEYFVEREPFIIGLSVPPRRDRITRSAVGGVVDDIVSASGGIFSAAIVKQNGLNVELFQLGLGEKAKAETISFI